MRRRQRNSEVRFPSTPAAVLTRNYLVCNHATDLQICEAYNVPFPISLIDCALANLCFTHHSFSLVTTRTCEAVQCSAAMDRWSKLHRKP